MIISVTTTITRGPLISFGAYDARILLSSTGVDGTLARLDSAGILIAVLEGN